MIYQGMLLKDINDALQKYFQQYVHESFAPSHFSVCCLKMKTIFSGLSHTQCGKKTGMKKATGCQLEN